MNKTIAALATPSGISGLAVIRVSGEEAIEIVDKIFVGKKKLSDSKSHTIKYGKIISGEKSIDSVTVSIFKKPNSYTGEDVIEISCHGGFFTVRSILDLLYSTGASPAGPGEFTERAFINGKIDLLQVEAIADIIHSQSKVSSEISVRQNEGHFSERLNSFIDSLIDIASKLELENDFADEGVELISIQETAEKIKETIDFCSELIADRKSSEILRSGYFVAVVGYPNAGKSSLFNAVLKKSRAIISSEKGTTRDYLEESLIFNDLAVKLIDTAGIRESDSAIEIEGIKLSHQVIESANMLLVLNDISEGKNHSEPLYEELKKKYPDKEVTCIQNKIDLIPAGILNSDTDKSLSVSSKTGTGIEAVKEFIYKKASESTDATANVLINQRHTNGLSEARYFLKNALNEISNESGAEIVAFELRSAIKKMEELTGKRYNEDVINHIFSGFCIGK